MQMVVSGLQAWYGESHILHGVDFDVRRGEVVTLLGRNGAGKTTTLKSIMGIVGKRKGSAKFEGTETVGLASDRIARLGVAICPEERGIFASLSVRENLMLPPRVSATGGLDLDRIFTLFPNLRERLGSVPGIVASHGKKDEVAAVAHLVQDGWNDFFPVVPARLDRLPGFARGTLVGMTAEDLADHMTRGIGDADGGEDELVFPVSGSGDGQHAQ